jgi:hypothetical protein
MTNVVSFTSVILRRFEARPSGSHLTMTDVVSFTSVILRNPAKPGLEERTTGAAANQAHLG